MTVDLLDPASEVCVFFWEKEPTAEAIGYERCPRETWSVSQLLLCPLCIIAVSQYVDLCIRTQQLAVEGKT